MKITKWLDLLSHAEVAYKLYERSCADARDMEILSAKLAAIGAKEVTRLYGNPAYQVGSAVELGKAYNISLHVGTHRSECRAVLERRHWQHAILDGVKSCEFGSFWEDQSHDKIESIYAFSHDVRIAICKCVLYARIAGVIE